MGLTVNRALDSEVMDVIPNTNNLLSISQPPEFILKLLIIQSRDNAKTAFEKYFDLKSRGISPDINRIKARLMGLFMEVRDAYKEYMEKNNEDFKTFEKELLDTRDFNFLYEVRNKLDAFLYEKKLIKFDNKAVYDPRNLEKENHQKHL